MRLQQFEPGDRPRISATFRDATGALLDPTTVKFIYTTPAGTKTTYVYLTDAALVRASAGVYRVDLPIPTASASVGKWQVGFEALDASSNPLSAEDKAFQVVNSHRI